MPTGERSAGGPRVALTPGQRARLERLAAAPSSRQSTALRARIVLGCSVSGPIAVADELGVAYNTVVKWCRRFEESDVEGLLDRQRSGRPTTVGSEEVRAVLAAPLHPPPPGGWSTRAVARELGLSQTAVSRIRRRAFGEPGDRPPIALSGPQLLVWVHLSPGFRGLGFQTPATAPATPDSAPQRRARSEIREDLRVVLSAGVALPTGPDRQVRPGPPDEADDLVIHLRRLHALVPSDRRATVVLDTVAERSDTRWLHGNPRFGLATVEPQRWPALLEVAASAIDPRQVDELADLADRMRRWAAFDAADGRPFDWYHVPSVIGRRGWPGRGASRRDIGRWAAGGSGSAGAGAGADDGGRPSVGEPV
ncbi:helix-turn-helix domain-containing protein, partial [Millisia brevis]|uniref:helix-turn-helix domain-containing protein n=1 Tax=Millisia brevis TaxID=264148 RepID=UPI0012EE4553